MSPAPAPLPSPDGKARRRLAALLLLALGLRIAHFLYVRDAIVLEPRGYLDDAFYYRLAALIAGGDLTAGTEAFFLPPLYAYFLGGLFALFRPGLDAPFLVQAVLGTLAGGSRAVGGAKAGRKGPERPTADTILRDASQLAEAARLVYGLSPPSGEKSAQEDRGVADRP